MANFPQGQFLGLTATGGGFSARVEPGRSTCLPLSCCEKRVVVIVSSVALIVMVINILRSQNVFGKVTASQKKALISSGLSIGIGVPTISIALYFIGDKQRSSSAHIRYTNYQPRKVVVRTTAGVFTAVEGINANGQRDILVAEQVD